MVRQYVNTRQALVLLGVLVSGIGFQLALPQISSTFIDAAAEQRPLHDLINLALAFWGIAALSYGVTLARTYLAQQMGWRATNQLREDLAAHVLHLDMAFHNQHTPGELIERIDGDVSTLLRLFSEMLLVVVSNLLLLAGILVLLLLEETRIGLVACAFAGLALLLLYRMRHLAVTDFEQSRQTSALLFSFIEERLNGLEDIRANGGDQYARDGLLTTMQAYAQADLRAYRKIIFLRCTTLILFSGGTLMALALGAFFYTRGWISIGTVYLIYAYMRMLSAPIEELVLEIQDFQTAMASLRRVRSLLQVSSAMPAGDSLLPAGALAVSMEAVTFGYAPDEPVLQDISLDLPAGMTLGLLGHTGSGKTTLTRLLARLYDPQRGEIRIADIPVTQFATLDLRHKVALVTQDVQIFGATLRENMTLFDPDIADDQLLEVIRTLGLQPWYDRLPQGLDTLLHADQLSAGEAQLIALTRVFLLNPGLVILDEASSRLDPATEALLSQAVERLLSQRTGIIIAHRLETVQHVDQILILDHGHIVEYGARATLAADPGSHFSQLMQHGLQGVLA